MCVVECVGGKKYLGEEEEGKTQSDYTIWKNIFSNNTKQDCSSSTT